MSFASSLFCRFSLSQTLTLEERSFLPDFSTIARDCRWALMKNEMDAFADGSGEEGIVTLNSKLSKSNRIRVLDALESEG